eukprot:5737673-Pleurochrysis_carterae.AAC.1
MAYLAISACHGPFQAINACYGSPHSETNLINFRFHHASSFIVWVGDHVYYVFTPRNTLADKSTPSTAYLAVNACYRSFRTNDACYGSPREPFSTLPYRTINFCYTLPFHFLRGSEYAIGKSIFGLYCFIFAERQQYEYLFCPQPVTPYNGEGGTGMSNCCDSPTHTLNE